MRIDYALHTHEAHSDYNPLTKSGSLTDYMREPGSALTHLTGLIAAAAAAPGLLRHAAARGADQLGLTGLLIFMLSMILLYGASTAYHTLDRTDHINRILKKIDHLMICVLIAGSYTPVCLTLLRGPVGYRLLAMVWGLAAAGMIFKLFFVFCPKWVSSVLYISMGWVCVIALPQIVAVFSLTGFLWLLAGGLFYTVGGVIYALKFPVFHDRFRYFGSHELFHVFVMAGSLCHYIVMYNYL